MLKQKTLEDIIREKIPLGIPNERGFCNVRCAVCNDYQERGGFKFDGDTTGYSCWNCNARFKYEEGTGKLSRNAREILDSFGIKRETLTELTSAIFLNLAEKEEDISLDTLNKVSTFTPEVAFPDRTHQLLSEGHDELQEPLLKYLLSRHINPILTRLYFSLDPKMLRRVIIPFWRDGKLIYWQARTIDADVKPRYLNCVVKKEAVIYGFDRLFSRDDRPLFSTEGVFDAIPLDGISTIGSKLTEAKIEILKKTRRRLIFVIDRDQTGGELARQVLENGWEITFTDVRTKDINDSITKYGLPFTAYSLVNNATDKADKIKSSIDLEMGLLEGRLRSR